MFDKPLHYTKLKEQDLSLLNDRTYPDKRTIYKVKTADKKPFLIYIEKYGKHCAFVKFHPSKHTGNPNKYKLRINYNHLPVRVISSCIAIMSHEVKNCPDLCIGIYGQWDKQDIRKRRSQSQRYKIWLQIAVSKAYSNRYMFVNDEDYNFIVLVPKSIYSKEFINKTQAYFEKRFHNYMERLRVPLP